MPKKKGADANKKRSEAMMGNSNRRKAPRVDDPVPAYPAAAPGFSPIAQIVETATEPATGLRFTTNWGTSVFGVVVLQR